MSEVKVNGPELERGGRWQLSMVRLSTAFLVLVLCEAQSASALPGPVPLLLCSRGGRDGFGSQYFNHMAVFAACASVEHCCYVHAKLFMIAHGTNMSQAEATMGLVSGGACRPILKSPRRAPVPGDEDGSSVGCSNVRLDRSPPRADWHLSQVKWPRSERYAKWQFLGNETTRRSLRRLYDDAADRGPTPPDPSCRFRLHVRRGDHVRGGRGGAETNSSLKCVVDALVRANPGERICVYSEGAPANFGPLRDHPAVDWRLNGDPLHAFHELVHAPVLFVAAKSTFSAAAAVLNVDGEIYHAPARQPPTVGDDHYNALASCYAPACECIAEATRVAWRHSRRECCADPRPAFRRGPDGASFRDQKTLADYEVVALG